MENVFVNLDAAESAFFSRQLEHVKSQVYPVMYPELKARTYIPVDTSAGDGVNTISYRTEDLVGKTKVIADYGKDLPRVDIKGAEHSQIVRDLGVSFGYNIREIRAAARAQKDLPASRALAARKVAEIGLDDIAFGGDATAGLKGFANHASVSVETVATGVGGLLWSQKTGDEMIADINEAVAQIVSDTKGIHAPTTVLLPLEQYTLFATKRMSDLDVTALKFFLGTSPFITEVMPWYKLDAAGGSSADRMIVYKRSPEVCTLEVPSEFEMLAPQPRGLEFVVPCRLVTAGVICYQPKAIAYRDGI